jgi:hypothetical protein
VASAKAAAACCTEVVGAVFMSAPAIVHWLA